MLDDNDLFIWEKLRDSLRSLRGQNLFRGRETHDAENGVITLERERRGEGGIHGRIEIRFGEKAAGIFAEIFPERKKIVLSDFEDNLNLFLTEVVAVSRGKEYLHTNSEKADYRKEKQE